MFAAMRWVTVWKLSVVALALLACAPGLGVQAWIKLCEGRVIVVGHKFGLAPKGIFRIVYTEEKSFPHRIEAVKVEDPLAQVDQAHPFEVTFNDTRARARLTYVEESLKKRGVLKKVYISDREVIIVASDEHPEHFAPEDFTAHTPVILVFTKKVDENINGTFHGVISELFLSELEVSQPRYRETTQKTIDEIVARVQRLPAFRDRDPKELHRLCKRIIFLRLVWLAKQEFYENHPEIRPAYAALWSTDRQDLIKNEQQIEF